MDLIPYPSELISKEGSLDCKKLIISSSIVKSGFSKVVDIFIEDCKKYLNGEKVHLSDNHHADDKKIDFDLIEDSNKLEKNFNPENIILSLKKESYKLVISRNDILLSSSTTVGLFWATRTLLQILMTANQSDGFDLPCVEIYDQPYLSWRGAMLDSARHYQTVTEIKKFIDTMAFHKLNRFHWHLTEDQGWRIEIKKFPKLTEVGSVRKKTLIGLLGDTPHRYDDKEYGGYYSQSEIKEIVQYAMDRGITVVPEIGFPGHAQAAIASYPELGCSNQPILLRCKWGISSYLLNPNEYTVNFLKQVFSEVAELFPSPWIHIGGDEAVKEQWESSPSVQKRMKELGIKNEENLQGWMTKEIAHHLKPMGKKIIVWDEAMEGDLDKDIIVMAWRGDDKALKSAQKGNHFILASKSHNYLDYYQADQKSQPLAIGGMTTCKKAYEYPKKPEGTTSKDMDLLIGLQGQLWTEYIPNFSHLEYMAYPRLSAIAENAWLPNSNKSWGRFSQSWKIHKTRLDLLKVNYYQGKLD